MQRSNVILVNIPYVGAPGSKIRPALVLQNDTLNTQLNETIIAEITSNTRSRLNENNVSIKISTPEGSASGLLRDSLVRCNRLHTIPQADVQRVIGHLSADLMRQVEDPVKNSLEM
ncbi:type II toxin-antitoxin system PemK/MazF family toxin [uncultured Gimesia sp.]|jgi:mRNA interferase MazF|uniref:type II toxin-antitoxin system PemK/MazF family toxin n=1 Tax=uncultured Gimesia sp. TaxID=1678688 RepID=UPI002628BE5B|nr:type II toxin-antitoxin system PemK/MazF family toxin [uncultured Gimesia sp.]